MFFKRKNTAKVVKNSGDIKPIKNNLILQDIIKKFNEVVVNNDAKDRKILFGMKDYLQCYEFTPNYITEWDEYTNYGRPNNDSLYHCFEIALKSNVKNIDDYIIKKEDILVSLNSEEVIDYMLDRLDNLENIKFKLIEEVKNFKENNDI